MANDFEIISELENDGFHYINKCIKDPEVDMVSLSSYVNLYVDGQLFDQDTVHNSFLNIVVTENIKDLWDFLLDNCLNIQQLINFIVDKIAEFLIPRQLKVLSKLFNKKSVKYINIQFMYNIAKKIKFKNKFNHVDKIQKLISLWLTDNNNKEIFIASVSNLMNSNISRMNMNQTIRIEPDKDLYLYFITNVLLGYFNTNYTTELIDQDYISDTSCSLNWYDKKNTNKQYSFMNKLFFVILAAFRTVISPLYFQLNELYLNQMDIKNLIDNLKNSNNMSQLIKRKISQNEQSLSLIEKCIDMIKLLLDDEEFNSYSFRFYETFSQWTLSLPKKHIILDDMFDNLAEFIMNYLDEIPKIHELGTNTSLVISKIFSSKKYTKNPEIRYKFIMIYSRIVKETNKYHEDTAQFLIDYHNDIDGYGLPNDSKFRKKQIVYNIINSMPYDILDKVQQHPSFYKLIYKSLTDSLEIFGIYSKTMKDSEGIDISSPDYSRVTAVLSDILLCIKIIVVSLVHMSYNKILIAILRKDECIELFAPLLNSFINFFPTITEKDQEKEIINIINDLLKLTLEIDKGSKKLIDELTCDDYIFKKDNYERIREYASTEITKLLDNILSNNYGHVNEDEIPEEFLDPLTYKLIENPILLPNMNNVSADLFLDKVTMIKQLLSKEENPFTRQKLTLEELNNYNKEPDVVKKINSYKEKLAKWQKKDLN